MNYKNQKKVIYSALIIIFVLSTFIYLHNEKFIISDKIIEDLIPNLIIEFLSIIFIVFLVERIDKIEKERERRRLEILALRLLKPQLTKFIKIFIQIIIFSQPTGKVKPITNINEAFSESYLKEIKCFNSGDVWPKPKVTCGQYLSNEITTIKSNINIIVAKYAPSLNVQFLIYLENILNNEFIVIISDRGQLLETSDKNIIDFYSLLNMLIKEYNVFSSDAIEELEEIWNNNSSSEGICRIV